MTDSYPAMSDLIREWGVGGLIDRLVDTLTFDEAQSTLRAAELRLHQRSDAPLTNDLLARAYIARHDHPLIRELAAEVERLTPIVEESSVLEETDSNRPTDSTRPERHGSSTPGDVS